MQRARGDALPLRREQIPHVPPRPLDPVQPRKREGPPKLLHRAVAAVRDGLHLRQGGRRPPAHLRCSSGSRSLGCTAPMLRAVPSTFRTRSTARRTGRAPPASGVCTSGSQPSILFGVTGRSYGWVKWLAALRLCSGSEQQYRTCSDPALGPQCSPPKKKQVTSFGQSSRHDGELRQSTSSSTRIVVLAITILASGRHRQPRLEHVPEDRISRDVHAPVFRDQGA